MSTVVGQVLANEPWVEVHADPQLGAYCARSVFDVWYRLEVLTGCQQQPPYWATVWPGARALIAFICRQRQWVQGRRVIDIGCGAGVVGLATQRLGATRVLANDVDAFALQATRTNAERNGVHVECILGDLTRGPRLLERGDVVLLSEMFYEASAAAHMWQWLKSVRSLGVQVLLADGGRPFFRTDDVALLERTVVEADFELEGVESRQVSVYTFT